MKSLLVLATLPLWLLLASATAASPTPASPTPGASPSPATSPSPSPTPSPSPIPNNAFLTIDVATGPVNTDITVSGGAFLANEQMTLYWDPPSTKVAGGANADASGNFTTHVKPFASDAPGIHHLCASVAPFPCANFTLVAATPTPSPSPSPDASPSPSPSPSDSPSPASSPSPAAATLSGTDLITRPPFVFIPIIGVLAILAALAYWVYSMFRRPAAPAALPAAAVVHRATRPDYTAEFGTPPAAPAPAPPPPSAWDDVMPPAQAQAATPPPPPVEPQAPSTDFPAGPDEPPDLPEPGDE